MIAAKAIALNPLSVGAAYGRARADLPARVRQSLRIRVERPIVSPWLPLFMFASSSASRWTTRLHPQEDARGLDRGLAITEEAVSLGIKSTAGVVTSAAAIMVAIFSGFGDAT